MIFQTDQHKQRFEAQKLYLRKPDHRNFAVLYARLTDADIPEGLYCYHLRHSDDGGKFCSVEPRVGVNHGGSVILKEPLDFGESGYIPLDEETSPNFSGEKENFSDFLSATSPQETEEIKLC